MNGSKEYFLKLSEETYNELPDGVKLSLNLLGMEVRQLPTEIDLEDENYKKIRNTRIKWCGCATAKSQSTAPVRPARRRARSAQCRAVVAG